MAFSQNSAPDEAVKKHTFDEVLNRNDGLLLHMHHTVGSKNGKLLRIRFIHCDFDKSSDQMCACDHEGNIFIVNFHYGKFWVLSNERANLVHFVPLRKNLILFGRGNGSLHFVNAETGRRVGLLDGHKSAVKFVSFTNEFCCLTATDRQAIVWDLKSNTQIHHLNLKDDPNTFKYIGFMPVSWNILACFDDDVMHVWKFKTFEVLKQILPEAWKGRHLQTITFTKNGRAMVLGGRSRSLVVFSTDTWTLERLIELPVNINGVRQLQFVPATFDGGNNKILAVLTLKNSFCFYDMERNIFLNRSIEAGFCISKFSISPNGKYLSVIYTTGELNIYVIAKLLKGDENPKIVQTKTSNKILKIFLQPPDETLDIKRLLPILNQFGEYPSEYRTLIWKAILKIPENQPAFNGLVARGFQPLTIDLDKKYPLKNKLSMINLKRVMATLINWSPLFSQTHNFVLFVYPFVRMFHNDPLANFEVILSLVLNWCQHWFQYFPFPPINTLCLTENILIDQDSPLLKHFQKCEITSEMFAWSLLETGFSEVLTRNEWLLVWDHLLSNHPSFIIVVAATYSIYNRNILLTLTEFSDFEKFYHSPNSIDITRFMAKCYQVAQSVNPKVDPHQYYHDFKELPQNTYPPFQDYPREVVDYQAKILTDLKKEENQLKTAEENIVKEKVLQLQRLKRQIRMNEEDFRKKGLNCKFEKELESEKTRLLKRKNKLNKLQQDVHDRELQILDDTKDQLIEANLQTQTNALDRTMQEIQHKQFIDELHDSNIEDQIRKRNEQLLAKKNHLLQIINVHQDHIAPIEHKIVGRKQKNLSNQYKEQLTAAESNQNLNRMQLATRITSLDNALQNMELYLAKEMADRHHQWHSKPPELKTSELENITMTLENDVAFLIQKIAECRLYDTETRISNITDNITSSQNIVKKASRSINELGEISAVASGGTAQSKPRSATTNSGDGCERKQTSPVLTIYTRKSRSEGSLNKARKPRKKSKFAL